MKLLDVQLERLRRWDRDGLLLIGDAAHAMSPVGGVGINLAVQDAVAAARLLGPALGSGGIVPRRCCARVQRRRWWPTALIQGCQRLAHRAVLGRALRTAPGQARRRPHPRLRHRPHRRTPCRLTGPSARRRRVGHGYHRRIPGRADRADPPGRPAPRQRGRPPSARPAWARSRPRPAAGSAALLTRFPVLQRIPARLVAIGPLPEHAPAWARRPAEPPATRRPDRAPTRHSGGPTTVAKA